MTQAAGTARAAHAGGITQAPGNCATAPVNGSETRPPRPPRRRLPSKEETPPGRGLGRSVDRADYHSGGSPASGFV